MNRLVALVCHRRMSPEALAFRHHLMNLLLVQLASGPIVPVAVLVFQFRAALPPIHVGTGGCHQFLVERLSMCLMKPLLQLLSRLVVVVQFFLEGVQRRIALVF